MCEQVDVKSIMAKNWGSLSISLTSNCGKLLDLGDESYLQLVGMFYANVRTLKMGVIISLECQVKYNKFTLTESKRNQVLGLPTITQSALS